MDAIVIARTPEIFPDQLVLKMASYLPFKQLLRLASINKRWREIIATSPVIRGFSLTPMGSPFSSVICRVIRRLIVSTRDPSSSQARRFLNFTRGT